MHKSIGGVVVLGFILVFGGPFSGAVETAQAADQSASLAGQTGIASVYSYKGRRSASGEIINPSNLTAAHRTLRFGSLVRVTNKRNGRMVIVRIIDRGPFIRGRVIDLSPAAARGLGFNWGLAPVTLAVVGDRA